jgi:beta-N-acetylhexosaminidase
MSPEVLQGLLRTQLGFDGLVITDALEMGAVLDTVGLEESAVRALMAGADAVCLGADLGAEPEAVASVHAAILDAVRSGRVEEGRLREAAARVGGVRMARPASGPPDTSAGREAAARALLVDGDVGVRAPALVVDLQSPASIAAGPARHGFGDAMRRNWPATAVVAVDEAATGPRDLLVEVNGRGLVVVVRDAHRHEWMRATAEALLADAGGVLVETGVPRWRSANASGYIATHGTGRVNLDAAAERLTG